MGVAGLRHGTWDDVGMVRNGMDLHDHLLGTDRCRIDPSYPMASWGDEDSKG